MHDMLQYTEPAKMSMPVVQHVNVRNQYFISNERWIAYYFPRKGKLALQH